MAPSYERESFLRNKYELLERELEIVRRERDEARRERDHRLAAFITLIYGEPDSTLIPVAEIRKAILDSFGTATGRLAPERPPVLQQVKRTAALEGGTDGR